MSQPAPKMVGLPKGALVLLYPGLAALPLALAWASGLPPADPWAESAAAAGMVGMVMMVLQIGSSGRFRHLSGRIGIDVTMAFHKWAAPAALLLLLAHPLLLAGPFDPAAPWRMGQRLLNLLVAPSLMSAVAALLGLLILTGMALWRDRLPFGYGLWRISHATLALVALALALQHILDRGTYAEAQAMRLFWMALAGGAVALWAARHGLARLRPAWRITGVQRAAQRLWRVTLAGPGALRFRAGQFLWLRFGAGVSDHPFSIASPPQERELVLLIQEAGDFTAQVGRLRPGMLVGIDGPHGSFVADDLPEGDAVLLIAGGVGLAPILSILADLAHRRAATSVRVIYAARSRAALVDPAVLRAAHPTAELTVLADDAGAGQAEVGQGPMTPAHLTPLLAGLDPARTTALICGPGGMMTAMTDALHSCGLPLPRIRYERFSFGSGPVSQKDRRTLIGFAALNAAILALVLGFAFR